MDAQLRPVDDRLEAALARLLADGTLTPEQADAVRRESAGPALPVPATARTSWTSALAEVGGYVGAAFVFAAAVALTGPNWDRFAIGTKLATLLGPAALMVAAAVAVALSAPGGWRPLAPSDAPRRRLVSALTIVAGLLAAGATAVVTDGDRSSGTLVTATALTAFAVGYAGCRSALLHVALAIAAVSEAFTAYYGLTDDGGADVTVAGLIVAALGVVWAGLTAVRVLAERSLGFSAAAVMVFVGGETMVIDSSDGTSALGYVLMGAAAVAALAIYVALRDLLLLALGAAGLAVTVPQAVIDYSDGALGAAGALLVSGLSIVAASVLALRLRTATD